MEPETERALGRLLDAFPSLKSWWERHRETVRPIWSDILRPCHPDDVAAIVGDLIYGDLRLPANYEFDRLAILIRQESKAKAKEREARQEQREAEAEMSWREAVCVGGGWQRDLVRAIDRASRIGGLVRAGKMEPDVAAAEIDELRAFARNLRAEQDEPRHRCPKCRDRGLIEVWDPRFIAVARKLGECKRSMLRTVMTSCDCDAAEAFGSERKSWRPLPVYSPMIYFRVQDRSQASFAKAVGLDPSIEADQDTLTESD